MVEEADYQIAERMREIAASWEAAADQRSVFLACYGMMTRNTLDAIAQGEFTNPEWVKRLLRRFAEYYFAALDAYDRYPGSSPAVWRATFEYTRDSNVWALQKLLLGVNAHINYDLVLALQDTLQDEWDRLPAEERASRFADHCHVNHVIWQTIDAVQDEILEPVMPMLKWVDEVFGRADEWMISQLIKEWRDRVWRKAVELLETPDSVKRETLIKELEQDALHRTQAIYEKKWENIL